MTTSRAAQTKADVARLRRLIKKHKITAHKLAAAAGCAPGQAQNFIAGEYRTPRPATIDMFDHAIHSILSEEERLEIETKLTPDAS